MTARRAVVLVGRRKAARAAVKRLGYRAVELAMPRRDEQAVRAFGGTADDAVSAARAQLGDASPAAVVAVAEGAVPAAAAVRAHYGLAGLSPAVAARCHDKLAMKRAVSAAGVSCAPWVEVGGATTADELVERLGLPVVLKLPVSSGGRGVTVARTRDEVDAALAPGKLAEGFVDGVELSAETLLADGAPVFRNATRYLLPRWANVVPAALSAADRAAVEAVVDAAHAALGVDGGITHAELFLTSGGPVFGEIAARPPGGHIMELLELAYGFDPWEAVVRIALGDAPALPAAATRHAGVWLLHPGAGTVRAVDGVDDARARPGIARVRVSVAPGDVVGDRIGSGQSVGEIVATAPDHAGCADALEGARDVVQVALSAGPQGA